MKVSTRSDIERRLRSVRRGSAANSLVPIFYMEDIPFLLSEIDRLNVHLEQEMETSAVCCAEVVCGGV